MRNFFYLPQGLDLRALLAESGDANYYADHELERFYYLIDMVYLKALLRDKVPEQKRENGYVPIHATVLRKVIHPRHSTKTKTRLIQCGILETEPPKRGNRFSYSPRFRATRYRFTPAYRNTNFCRFVSPDSSILAKAECNRRNNSIANSAGHEGRLLIRKSVESLNFDTASARLFLETINLNPKQRQRREVIIDLFESQSHSFTADKAGRLYHIFTSCPRNLRQFATWRGQNLFAMDVANCQPALHAALYPAQCEEKGRYVEIVRDGRFYSFLNEKLSHPFDLSNADSKSAFKGEVFHRIFYGSPFVTEEPAIWRIFREEFPLLAEIIRELKKRNLRDLPISMQALEAKTVIDGVACDFAKKYGCEDVCLISIHDNLVTTEAHVVEVRLMMESAFKATLGFDVTVKAEQLSFHSAEHAATNSIVPLSPLRGSKQEG